MSQLCLLDSTRLSSLLSEALSWSETVSSLLVSARNGSILAYAFKQETPSIKAMRTKSTTMTAAYSVASESPLVFESQDSGAINVIAPVGDHVLLAVSSAESNPTTVDGSTPHPFSPRKVSDSEGHGRTEAAAAAVAAEEEEGQSVSRPDGLDRQQIRQDLELISQELSTMLQEELNGMKWPDDI